MEDEVKVDVYMRTYAHYTASVELTDDELKRIADEYGITVEELDPEQIREFAEDKAFTRGVPSLCHMEKIVLNDWESPDATEDAIRITER
jgi:predicted PilT family ATPase